MTIQNIHDVLARIMSLNKNLTEESLKTLLVASGWDDIDIKEGIRIFQKGEVDRRPTIQITEIPKIVEKPKIEPGLPMIIEEESKKIEEILKNNIEIKTEPIREMEAIKIEEVKAKEIDTKISFLKENKNPVEVFNTEKIVLETKGGKGPVFMAAMFALVAILLALYMWINNRF